jgi:hypothetical protein
VKLKFSEGSAQKRDSKEERAGATQDQKPSLEEEVRRLRQGAHRHRRQEAMVCRNPQKEVAILVEKLKKEQASD